VNYLRRRKTEQRKALHLTFTAIKEKPFSASDRTTQHPHYSLRHSRAIFSSTCWLRAKWSWVP